MSLLRGTDSPPSQQPGDRNCKNEAIGGSHYGPVIVYLTKVTDASTADGSTGWFKIYENGWKAANKGSGDNDLWGVKDMNSCCGKVDVVIPSQLAAGDYLLRAEVCMQHRSVPSC
jgi:lytic cellulose monooxygenase (C1-hydroxylating)